MKINFYDLTVNDIRDAINKSGGAINLDIISEAIMPEADVLICSYRGNRINIKCDLAYGAEVEFLQKLSMNDEIALEKFITDSYKTALK